tara:strand:+ start:957 stop:2882 length:1926 start_codon:yes stop_codon:yes gene_type:complete
VRKIVLFLLSFAYTSSLFASSLAADYVQTEKTQIIEDLGSLELSEVPELGAVAGIPLDYQRSERARVFLGPLNLIQENTTRSFGLVINLLYSQIYFDDLARTDVPNMVEGNEFDWQISDSITTVSEQQTIDACQRNSMRLGLHGDVTADGTAGTLNFDLTYLNCITGESLATYNETYRLDSLDTKLIDVANWIDDGIREFELPSHPKKEFVFPSARTIDRLTLLKDFSALTKHDKAEIEAAYLAAPNIRYLAVLKVTWARAINEHDSIEAWIEHYQKSYGGSSYFSLFFLSLFGENEEDHLQQKRLEWLELLIGQDPQLFPAYRELIDSYLDLDRPGDALAVASHLVSIQPDTVVAWWRFALSLQDMAWFYRTERATNQVSSNNTQKFNELLALSQRAVDVGLFLHPTHQKLLALRIKTHGGYSSELMSDFRRAVASYPKSSENYRHAMHYSQYKWGGNDAAQNEIIQLARLNLSTNEVEKLASRFGQDAALETLPNDEVLMYLEKFDKLLAQLDRYCDYTCQRVFKETKKYGISILLLISIMVFGFVFVRRRQKHQFMSALLDKVLHLKRQKVRLIKLVVISDKFTLSLPQLDEWFVVELSGGHVVVRSAHGVIRNSTPEGLLDDVLSIISTELDEVTRR